MKEKKFDYNIGDELVATHNAIYYVGSPNRSKIELKQGNKYVVISINTGNKSLFVRDIESGKCFDVHHYWLDHVNLDYLKRRFKKMLQDGKVKIFD